MDILAPFVLGILTIVPLASADTSPVTVKSCAVAYITEGSLILQGMQFTNGVTVTLANNSSKPVSGITVSGTYHGFKVTDSWSGTLVPSGTLSVWKHYHQLVYAGPNAECRVIKVTFTDGTTWAAPAPP